MKKNIMIYICLAVLTMVPMTNYVQGYSDRDDPYNLGKTFGYIEGELQGQRDIISNRKSDWEKNFNDIEDDVEENYNLDEETWRYRREFLKGFEDGFKEGYEKAYNNLDGDRKKSAYEMGLSHGELFGNINGDIDGRQDFYNGRRNNWTRNMPSDSSLRSRYTLNNENKQYIDGFLVGYKDAYAYHYTEAYRAANIDDKRLAKENAIDHGRAVGIQEGERHGLVDYHSNRTNNWKRPLPSDQEIILNYNLYRESARYTEGFLNGYKTGFQIGYIEAFQNSNVGSAINSTNYELVSMLGGNIGSSDGVMELFIEAGTFYRDTFFTIKKETFPSNGLRNLYQPASHIYQIEIDNDLNSLYINKPVKLSFQYYGSERAGIYKHVNGSWRYLYSSIDEGMLSTEIPTVDYEGGRYAIFIDTNYRNLVDINTHWGRQEIYTFLRRGYIAGYGDKTFRPDRSISRGEFVTLLNRVEGDNKSNTDTNVKNFKDYESFGPYSNAIADAIAKGYIQGYPDDTFRPHNPITYREIEWIIQRVISNSEFQWEEIEEKIFYEKYTKSNSFFGKDNNINRGEVVYLFYQLQEQKKL